MAVFFVIIIVAYNATCEKKEEPVRSQTRGDFSRPPLWFPLALLMVPAFANSVRAYAIRAPIPLKKIVQESDVIVKAKALDSTPVADGSFEKYTGYEVYATRFQVISVIKGKLEGQEVLFHHYGVARRQPFAVSFSPQLYEFEAGRTYIVFAKNSEQAGFLRQLWKNHTAKPDQGVMLAADGKPVQDEQVEDVLWAELNKMLAAGTAADALYAIRQLDEMSRPLGFAKLSDFDREKALAAVAHFLSSRDERLAKAAIQAVGGFNPYFRDDYTNSWLTKVGGRSIAGHSPWETDGNPGAHKYYQELIEAADSGVSADVRAAAIRALGRAGQPKIWDCVSRWLNEGEPSVREAALLLLADFPVDETKNLLDAFSLDKEPRVRKAVARVIGFSQIADLLPSLDRLLLDEKVEVRTAAALSLLSFDLKKSSEYLRAKSNDPDFKSVFINALAEENPKPYLDSLCEIIEKQLQPANFWGGTIPSFASWQILFKYLEGQTEEILKSGQLDRYLDGLERGQIHSSSEPRDLYALYVKNRMTGRARKFREYINKVAAFDLEYFFNQVDAQYGVLKEN
jgi:HEAT repeat protein